MNNMTVRKYNMIKKCTYLDGRTFTDIFIYLENILNLKKYTAKQIAEIMEICYMMGLLVNYLKMKI